MVSEFDKEVYLSKMIGIAHGMKDEFGQEMEALAGVVGGSLKVGEVKKKERAKEKILMEYFDEEKCPKSARIVDLLRCSITFESVGDLVHGLGKVREFVEGNEHGGAGLVKIVRVKNTFSAEKAGEYQDVKLNCVFSLAKMGGVSMIVEIQMILQEFLSVKKEGHRLYAITRQVDLFKMVFDATKGDSMDKQLYQSGRMNNLKSTCKLLLFGADPNRQFNVWSNVLFLEACFCCCSVCCC